jgi:hypothetical protein
MDLGDGFCSDESSSETIFEKYCRRLWLSRNDFMVYPGVWETIPMFAILERVFTTGLA